MPAPIDLTGQRFGRLTEGRVVRRDAHGKPVWCFRCDCGGTKEARAGDVRSGRISSCGCLKSPDLTGERYGRLQVIGRSGSAFLCRCDCGNEVVKVAKDLSRGAVNSCGCLRRESSSDRRKADLVGKRFGRYTVVDRDPENPRKWRCRCDCSEERFVLTSPLTRGHAQSCGCLRAELKRDRFALNAQLKAQEAGEWDEFA